MSKQLNSTKQGSSANAAAQQSSLPVPVNTTGVVELGNGGMLDQHQAVVSSTFANLELASTKATLQQYVDLYESAKRENVKLAKEIQERDKDALQVVEFLRYDIEEKNTNLRESEQKLATVREHLEVSHAEEVQKWRELVEEKDRIIAKNKSEMLNLHKELESVALFKREKQELFLEVAKHKEQHASTVNRYEKELTKLRFQALEDKVLLRAAEKEMVEKFNEEVDARAMLLVNTKAKDIHKENQQLQKDQRSLTEQVDKVTAANEQMKVEVHEVRREAQLGRELQKEYAKQGVQLSAQVKDASDKAKHLENKLCTVVDNYELKLSQTEIQKEQTVSSLQSQLAASQKNEKVLMDELVKMRRLSQRIVRERSELEAFFHDALEHVRSQQRGAPLVAPAPPHSTRSTLSRSKVPRLPSVEMNLNSAGSGQKGPSSARSARIPGTAPTSIISRGSSTGETTVLTARSARRDEKMLLASVGREQRVNQLAEQSIPQGQLTISNERNSKQVSRDPEDDAPDFSATPSLPDTPPNQDVAGSGVDFGKLSWHDKETVIRALLFKINQQFYNPRKVGVQTQKNTPGQGTVEGSFFATDPNSHEQPYVEKPHTGREQEDLGLQGPEYAGYEVLDEQMRPYGSTPIRGGTRGPAWGRPGTGDSVFGQRGPLSGGSSSAIPSSAGSAANRAGGYSLPGRGGLASSQSQRPGTRGAVMSAVGTPAGKLSQTPGSAQYGRGGLPPTHPKSLANPQGAPPGKKLSDGLSEIAQKGLKNQDPNLE